MKYKKGDKGKPDKDRKKSDIRVGPSYEVAHAAAAVVIRVLKDMGMTAAVFGSIAYKLYGSTRNPNVSVAFSMNTTHLRSSLLTSDPDSECECSGLVSKQQSRRS